MAHARPVARRGVYELRPPREAEADGAHSVRNPGAPVEPLLQSKLIIPPQRATHVHRQRLIQALDAGVRRTLTLLSAPAGAGKTTLLSEWAAQAPTPVAWVSLDADDADPIRFWRYLIASLEHLASEIAAATTPLLYSPQPATVSTIATVFLNACATLTQELTLILDDFHTVDGSARELGMPLLLDRLPSTLHLIIASRVEPSLSLARLRMRDDLVELRMDDLRFTRDEATLFLRETMGLSLAPAEVALLEERTEGWIAALQVAALSLRGQRDGAAGIETFRGDQRTLFTYLAEEVFERQPPSVQSFLLDTAILDRFDAPLCAAVSGALGPAECQATLELLDVTNVFVVPLDDRGREYRYHHLFAEFLRERLRRADSARASILHLRAARWYEQCGMAHAAVNHALAAGELGTATRLIERISQQALLEGDLGVVRAWLRQLPESLVRERPQLALIQAWALLFSLQPHGIASFVADAEAGVRRLEREPGADEETNASLRRHVMVLRAIIAGMSLDAEEAITLAEQALAEAPHDDLFLRSMLVFNVGFSLLASGRLQAATQALRDVKALSQRAGARSIEMVATWSLARLELVQGRLGETYRILTRALDDAKTPHGAPLIFASAYYVILGELYYEWNELERAAEYLTQGVEVARTMEHNETIIEALLGLARVRLAQGMVDEAERLLQQTEALRRGAPAQPGEVAHIYLLQAQVALASRGGREAARWLHDAFSQPATTPEPQGADFLPAPAGAIALAQQWRAILLARLLLLQGKPEEALALVEDVLATLAGSDKVSLILQARAVRAAALWMSGARSTGAQALCEVLADAQPEGFIRTFVDCGPPMERLLAKLLNELPAGPSQGVWRDASFLAYVRRVHAAFSSSFASGSSAVASEPPQTRVTGASTAWAPPAAVEANTRANAGALRGPLSERERAVLRYIAAGASNAEIAQALTVEVSTVKKHIHHILAKLQARNRVQALARAQALGIL